MCVRYKIIGIYLLAVILLSSVTLTMLARHQALEEQIRKKSPRGATPRLRNSALECLLGPTLITGVCVLFSTDLFFNLHLKLMDPDKGKIYLPMMAILYYMIFFAPILLWKKSKVYSLQLLSFCLVCHVLLAMLAWGRLS